MDKSKKHKSNKQTKKKTKEKQRQWTKIKSISKLGKDVDLGHFAGDEEACLRKSR